MDNHLVLLLLIAKSIGRIFYLYGKTVETKRDNALPLVGDYGAYLCVRIFRPPSYVPR
jgi:hypothetical protein